MEFERPYAGASRTASIIALVLALLLFAGAWVGLGVSQGRINSLQHEIRCTQPSPCQFTLAYADGSGHVDFDLSALANLNDTVVHAPHEGYTYHAKLCGSAEQQCRPKSWRPNAHAGAAVQLWGPEPTQGGVTRDCEVLGTAPPNCTAFDRSNLASGGMNVTFRGVFPGFKDWNMCHDPHWNLLPRTLTYVLRCNQDVDVQAVRAVEESPCSYVLEFESRHLCNGAKTSTSNTPVGWIVFVVLSGLVTLYVVGGVAFSLIKFGDFAHPHAPAWLHGFERMTRVCRRRGEEESSLLVP